MRTLKEIPCSECGKVGVLCKGLCQACYSKKQRNTPEGKLKMKLYNDTKGVEARQKYLAKKPPKPPKEIEYCECGKEVVAKGLCFTCYQKYYQRKKRGWKQRQKTDYTKKVDYNLVLNLVKEGMTIQVACHKAKINRSLFYKVITKQQKAELRAYKSIGALVSDDVF